jgi:hypothetical protein
MRPLTSLALVSVLALAACQTPREACLSEASSRLRIVDSLIRETEGNLDRGFALETEQEVEVIRDTCRVRLEDGTTGTVRCDRTDVDEVQRPVAIDLRAEQAKLDSLLEQRARLVAERDTRAQACIATYPE